MARVPAGIKKAELVELLEIDEQIKALEARKAVLRDKALRAHGDFVGSRVYGDVIFTLTLANTFDSTSFAAANPFDQHPEFYRHAVNASAVPKELKEQFVTPVQRLSVRRAEKTLAAA